MDDETDGILVVGEVPSIIRRQRINEENHDQAWRSGRESAFGETLAYVEQRFRAAGAYDDTRPWTEMTTFLQDRIRENGTQA
jgi:hypothetical protein